MRGGAGGVCCVDVQEFWPVLDFSKRIQRGEKAQDGMLAVIVLGTDRGRQVQGDWGGTLRWGRTGRAACRNQGGGVASKVGRDQQSYTGHRR